MADDPQSGGSLSPSSSGGSAAAMPGASGERPERTSSNKGVAAFLRASWAELQRVRWPDGRQVGQGTVVVLVFTVIAGVLLGAVDRVATEIIDLVL